MRDCGRGGGRFCLIYLVGCVRIVLKWGSDEVVKRISCRVVRSVPLSGSGDFSRRSRPGDAQRSMGYYEDARHVRLESAGDSFDRGFGAGAGRVTADAGPTGRFLDFHA